MIDDETILFKSVSFLTTLVKCSRGFYYLNNGFNEGDLEAEVIKALDQGLKLNESKDYIEKIKSELPAALLFLQKENLIFIKDNRYYITEEGENITEFMLSLSKMYTITQIDLTNIPYRKYPNTNIYYGLN